MQKLHKSFFLLSVAFLVSCAQLGLEKPDTTPQRLAYATTTITQVREQTFHLLQNKRLNVEDARKVQNLADVARLGVEKSTDLYFAKTNNNKPEAMRFLESAEQALAEAVDILQKMQIRP